MKFYIHTGGGLGDMIKHYFWGHHGWQYAKSVKEKYPEAEIKLLTTCCNPVGHNLFKYFPYIDKIESHPWVDPNRPWKGLDKHIQGYKDLARAPELLKDPDIVSSPPSKIYLSKEDRKELSLCTPEKDLLVVHPFAGDAIRMKFPVKEFFLVAELLARELGYNVLVIGGNSQRVIGAISRTINEQFPYKAAGVTNLLDKISIRSAVALTLLADHFIGTNSCFYCARLATGQSVTLLFSNHIRFTREKPMRLRKDDINYIIIKQGEQMHLERTT
jgi:ADP-heptose:LPS heptosyltransferase